MNRILLVLAGILTVSLAAFAVGTLQIDDVKVEGDQVVLSVVLGGDVGSGVSAMDFRLNYNPQVLRPLSASTGVAAGDADKRVMANLKTPGEYIVVMMGMNKTTCSSGEVAKVVLERVGDSSQDNWGLDLSRSTLSSLDGTVIPSQTVPYSKQSGGKTRPGSGDAKKNAPESPKVSGPPAGGEQAKTGESTPSASQATTAVGSPVISAGGPEQLSAALEAAARTRATVDTPVARALPQSAPRQQDTLAETGEHEQESEARPMDAGGGVESRGTDSAPEREVVAKLSDSVPTVEVVAHSTSGAVAPASGSGAETPAKPTGRVLGIVALGAAAVMGALGLVVLRRRLFN